MDAEGRAECVVQLLPVQHRQPAADIEADAVATKSSRPSLR
jgi:hypothetical protein